MANIEIKAATNAYRYFITKFCRSCPLKTNCSLLNKISEFQQRETLDSTNLNAKEIQTMDENLSVSSEENCFLCLDILHRFTTDEFLEKIKKIANSTTEDFQSFSCHLTLPMNFLIRQNFLLKFLRKFVGECHEKDLPSLKEHWRILVIDRLEKLLERPHQIDSPFEIDLKFSFTGEQEELNFLRKFRYADNPKLKKSNANEGFTRQSVVSVLENLTFEDFEKDFKANLNGKSDCIISAQHESVFIAGRYNKFSRTLSQTPWIIDGVRKAELSVEELIAEPLKELIPSKSFSFLSSGREDVDVRTLGLGRPFVIEFHQPGKTIFKLEDFRLTQKKINESTKEISVRDLQQVTKEESNKIKEGEEEKTKTYEALCYIDSSIDQEELDACLKAVQEPLTIEQKTPIRVLHRRTVMTRSRLISSLFATLIDPFHFRLRLTTQAGTYVKEFVHGDFGRTKPNMTEILGRFVDIIELDVLAVNIDFPPQIDTEIDQQISDQNQ